MRNFSLFGVAMLTVAVYLVPATAQTPAPAVRASSPVSVVGRDAALSVAGNLAPACAGKTINASLYHTLHGPGGCSCQHSGQQRRDVHGIFSPTPGAAGWPHAGVARGQRRVS